jgi:hypothetical protein
MDLHSEWKIFATFCKLFSRKAKKIFVSTLQLPRECKAGPKIMFSAHPFVKQQVSAIDTVRWVDFSIFLNFESTYKGVLLLNSQYRLTLI